MADGSPDDASVARDGDVLDEWVDPGSDSATVPPGLALGFGLGAETTVVLSELRSGDFVDLMYGPSKADLVAMVPDGIFVACIGRSLPDLETTASYLDPSGAPCDYLGYNPEQRAGTPDEEFVDFVASVETAAGIASDAGTGLLVGPGLNWVMDNESLLGPSAAHADVWLLQGQGFQIDATTGTERATPEQFAADVGRIVTLLRADNPDLAVWVQLSVTPGPVGHEHPFSAEELAALALALEDIADGVRIYAKDAVDRAAILTETIALVRAAEG